ncbi:hypothetical protein E05_32900 [Plautia stali symbiont]|nr:hypothetical protein E05_32900 [Plautia stali symbiont]
MLEEQMNDEFKGKSGKVKVMYVRDEEGGQKPNPRTGKGGRPACAPGRESPLWSSQHP